MGETMNKEERDLEREKNLKIWNQELEFWKKRSLSVFHKVEFDDDVISMTYCEFKSLLRREQ